MFEPKFKRQKPLLNTNERILYKELKLAVGNDYLLVPQVHVEKLIAPVYGSYIGKIKYAVGHVSRWSVDFALFDISTLEPLLAIELNGESHNNPKTKKRDIDVRKHCEEAGIGFLTFQNYVPVIAQELRARIDLELSIKRKQLLEIELKNENSTVARRI
ncbi:MAG: hypothetical protein JWN89_445 [Parcubacteria group bacterium]|nr:hypothetical protein [Parcubacteria group bacterium]